MFGSYFLNEVISRQLFLNNDNQNETVLPV